ncbi:competence protein ComK [Planococcus rifietoensis]|uniref:competence protein ComK n=1 Tax=Planococcus rifietoensis TaxID=200991 RepID=UPI00384D9905
MKNCGDLQVDLDVLFLESWYETGRRSRITTTYGVFYSPDTPLTLIDKASMLFALPNNGHVKATRHNLKIHGKNIILFSTCGLAAYPTHSPCQLGCVWIFNHPYKLEAISSIRTRIIYERFGISKEVEASIHNLSKQRKQLHEIIF